MKTLLLFLMLTTPHYAKRQVLIFYGVNGTALKNKQLSLLNADKHQLLERDIEIHTYNISESEPEVRHRNIKPTSDFTFLLLGKDGHEAIRTDTIIRTKQLFAIIDAMPMRRRQMKENKE